MKIRKQKKEQQLKKKREDAAAASTDTTTTSTPNPQLQTGGALSIGNDRKPTIADVPRLKAMLIESSASEESLLEATRGFRRILSVEKNIPAQELVDSGIVPYLVRNLTLSSQTPCATSLIFESAWALTNIASTECTIHVVNAGCIRPLVDLLMHGDANIREQAAWCLGNIAGEGPEFRDMILEQNAIDSL